ncbi:MAG: peroxiredoxin-2-like [Deltaproteobacteria bacterium]|nr:peroxiredoxin-2-like [Deltaproteobacteria bacterium]
MSLVGKPAPDFELEGYFTGQFSKYKLSDYRKKWVLLLFYPLDFTFVCPTEVLNFSAAAEDLGKINCQIFGISPWTRFMFIKHGSIRNARTVALAEALTIHCFPT